MKGTLPLLLVFGIALASPEEARAQEPDLPEIQPEGDFNTGSDWVAAKEDSLYVTLVVKNGCDWAQTVHNISAFHRYEIPAKSEKRIDIWLQGHLGTVKAGLLTPQTAEFYVTEFDFVVNHFEAVQGNTRCLEESLSIAGRVAIVTDTKKLLPTRGRLMPEWRMELVQEEMGTGLEYPVTPTPPGATGTGVDEDKVFDPDPQEAEKPPTPAPADVTDLGDMALGSEYEMLADVRVANQGMYRDMASCTDKDACSDDGGTDFFLGNPARPPDPKAGDSAFQQFGGEAPRVRIDVTSQRAEAVPPRLNPLGLLAKSFDQFLEWWMPTLHAAEELTQSGLQKGLQFLITSQGGSTGKNLTMQVLNFTGKPVNLQGMLALEPLKKDAQQKVTQAFTRLAGRHLPSKIDLNGYCLEFLKLPPVAGQIMRVAGPEVQKRFEPMKKIMAAANRLTAEGVLKPDSNPATYADSIKQWALWTAEQKFNEKEFGEAFLGHTKKNVEAAGQKWTKQIEDVVRQRTPSRWQDVVRILQSAGAPVPR